MGCTQSKIENEEAVSRCKERKIFMKEAVSARNAFAAAHSSYAMAVKNTGAALSDYAHGEVQNPSHSVSTVPPSLPNAPDPAIPQPPVETLPPPPPPPLSTMPASPLQRAVSAPEIKISSKTMGAPSTIIEEEDGIIDEEDDMIVENRERLTRKSRSRKSGGGSERGRNELDGVATRPRVVVEESMPQQQQQGYYDYFFPTMENMPGPTLDEVRMEAPPQRPKEVEQVSERKVFDERPNKGEEGGDDGRKSEAMKNSVESEKVSVAAAGGGSGRGAKKGKGVMEKRVVKGGAVNLVQIFVELDDHFLKASESAHEVSKMLEATRLHYHSNFADNRGHIDHSARVMRVITWNRSFKGMPDVDDYGKDDFDSEENETHATVLDKLLAWEKKLYDEVKAGELMKFEYQKKVSSLNKLKKRNGNSDALERAKAAVSHLHTRYIVDMQSMDSTVSEINRLRDEQLYPKLVQLVDGMATMWETMQFHHESQSKIVIALRSLDISQSPKETSKHHHERTIQLFSIVHEWHEQFSKIIKCQKDYVKALNSWLKLNLIPIESNLKEKVSSPPRVQSAPIQMLLLAWHDYIDKLPDEVARVAIFNFGAVIDTIMQQQVVEMALKEKCDETRKELARKTRQFEDWYNKYMQQRVPDDFDPDKPEDNPHKDVVAEKQFVVDALKKRLEEEEEAYQKQCLHVREKSLASLKTRLPELFRAMSGIASDCSNMYRQLRSISQAHNQSENSED
ncbi:uncharacterized protein LOC110813170 isoform X2 [Carica papaya]|uniref:uncharacterized protein LOC110813170 isoform X2 n=1 Tax=Carica papaya TaxID=3649 RepID=UPI000B8CF5DC|nr:uncharacterized protein LOC110813170 isoform X2 [Carica papaya]